MINRKTTLAYPVVEHVYSFILKNHSAAIPKTTGNKDEERGDEFE